MTKSIQTRPSRRGLEMTLDREALVIAVYLFADECSVLFIYGRPPPVTDAELVALAVYQAAIENPALTSSFSAWSSARFPVGFRSCLISRRTKAGCAAWIRASPINTVAQVFSFPVNSTLPGLRRLWQSTIR